MARLVVNAAVMPSMDTVYLVVSVSGNDDGTARSGLVAANFEVAALAADAATPALAQPVTHAVEGPVGVYLIELAGTLPAQSHQVTYAVTVTGDTESGWADDRGQALATGSSA